MTELHPWAPWCPLTYSLADATTWIAQQPAAREAGTAFEFLVIGARRRPAGLLRCEPDQQGIPPRPTSVTGSVPQRPAAGSPRRPRVRSRHGHSRTPTCSASSSSSPSETPPARRSPSRRAPSSRAAFVPASSFTGSSRTPSSTRSSGHSSGTKRSLLAPRLFSSRERLKLAGRGWGGASREPPPSTHGDPLEFARTGRGSGPRACLSEASSRGPPARPQRARKRVGRAQQAAVRRTAPHAAPGGIDEISRLVVSPVLRCSRALVLSSARTGAQSRSPRSSRGLPCPCSGLGGVCSGGYFFPFFFAGLAFTTGLAFLAGAFFAAALTTGRFPGVAIFEGLPSEATSPK